MARARVVVELRLFYPWARAILELGLRLLYYRVRAEASVF